ncbi:MAG TPA: glycoside hydrolase N-terminal domain-containing protein [Bacteroidales bacterium]|nr:glycoside hydrolase N-terminal domain-containing protein [Bacteroidales bacterium]
MKKNGIFFLVFVLLIMTLSCKNTQYTDSADDNKPSYKRGMTMITPSAQWREGLPSGNGIIGALVYGSINQERVLFNHNDLYYNGSFTMIPDMSEIFYVIFILVKILFKPKIQFIIIYDYRL